MTADQQSHDRLRSGGSTSRSLLANAKLALPAAWERLVRLYTPFVVACCRRWGVPEQDIGDVLQDVFSAVANHLHRFHKQQAHDTFRGWLVTITRNKVHDYFRRLRAQPAAGGGTEAARRMQQIPDDCAQQEAAGDEEQWAENTLLDSLLAQALEAIRGEFHARTWQAFWGVVVDGRLTADVAAELGMKPGAVRVAKSRVLLRLRRELGDVVE